MTTYIIAPLPNTSLSGVVRAYVGVFGILWLFVEPLGAFGLIPTLTTSSATYVYALLILLPAIGLFLFLRWRRWYKTQDLPFLLISIRSTADGVTYSLQVAENMQVNDFLCQFIKILAKGPAKESINAILLRHYPVLQVKRDGKYIDIDSNISLHAAGIKTGDECQLRAQMYEHLNQVMFSRTSDRR